MINQSNSRTYVIRKGANVAIELEIPREEFGATLPSSNHTSPNVELLELELNQIGNSWNCNLPVPSNPLFRATKHLGAAQLNGANTPMAPLPVQKPLLLPLRSILQSGL